MRAKKPMTTEGNPARSSITGLMISLTLGLANIAVYIAASIEMGAAKSKAISVTFSVPKNNGQIPYRGLSETGIQVFERSVAEGLSTGI